MKQVSTPNSEFWQSDRLFRLLVENAKEYAIFTMDLKGRITTWNPGAERLLGWSEEEAIGQNGAIIFTEEDREAGAPEDELALAARQGYAENTRWHVHKNGERFWTSAALETVENEEGELIGFAKILRDLTPVKKYEEALERSNRDLEAFASHVAHEVRSPLMGIRLIINSLLRNQDEIQDEDTREMIREAQAAIHHLDQFASDLLSYTRLSKNTALDRKRVASEEALNGALTDLRPLIEERGAEVEANRLPEVVANPTQLRHLFRNLISNAIEHNDADTPHVQVEAEETEDAWIFRVTDNGPGILDDEQKKIFSLFQRSAEDEQPGIGVGLALCKRIVERHDGHIEVESDPGRGTTFSFTLPNDRQTSA